MHRPATVWRRWRQKQRPPWSQATLARVLGITPRAVKFIESGQRHPRPATEQKFWNMVHKHETERKLRNVVKW